MLISVCICTFRRPALLLELLDAVGRQQRTGLGECIEIVVVDNDPGHSAQEALTLWHSPPGFQLVWLQVPEPNISVARNAATHQATGEWIVFVDDDETPVDNWLMSLMNAQRSFQADAVFGPVLPHYAPQTPGWIREGAYFERRRFPSGMMIDEADARTGNVLINARRLKSINGPFEPSFGRTGGEDSVLFRDLLALGCTFVWCDEACVSEAVPLERANAAWLLRRSFRVGQTWLRAELYRLPVSKKIVRGVMLGCRAGVQLVVSTGLALVWLPLGRSKSFHWMRVATMQAGKIVGLTRFQYHEYGA